MLNKGSDLFHRLHTEITRIPVVDCHEHMRGFDGRPKGSEPIAGLIAGYVFSDLMSAGFGVPDCEIARLQDPEVGTAEKWPLFHRLWSATEHTAYARVTKLVMRDHYGVDELSRDGLDAIRVQMEEFDEASYHRVLDETGIAVLLSDVLGDWVSPLNEGLAGYLKGSIQFPEKWRLLISLPGLHPTCLTYERIMTIGSIVGTRPTSLEEFLEAAYVLFERCKEKGVVGFKDQSAYSRILAYDLVDRASAERQFNTVMSDPRNALGWPEGKLLNDFLFHEYMRFARDLDLPVQLHTGHMAGIRNRAEKTNAAHLSTVLELHREVQFDLFHGNWPYMGDLLFLGKNYPNVAIDCCWAHIIDPDYTSELLARSVLTLPHTKVHGFGGDYGDYPEYVAAHLRIARENIASTLAGLVERSWLSERQAVRLAADWLFNNPNRFFRLGMPEIVV